MTDRKDRFEERVREALRSGGRGSDRPRPDEDADELLERIHRGAARRRARRRAGAVVATAGLVSAVAVALPVLTPPSSEKPSAGRTVTGDRPDRSEASPGVGKRFTDRAQPPKHRPKEPAALQSDPFNADQVKPVKERAVPVEVENVRVTSVSGPSAEELWISGYGTCNGSGLCNVLGHSGNGGADVEFRTLPVSGHSRQTTIRFSADGATGWATDGGAVYRTDSHGETWIRLLQPAGVKVADLEVWEDEVWAVGSRLADRQTVVLAGDRSSDVLKPVQQSRELTPEGAVALGAKTFGLRRDDPVRNFARTSDGGSRWAETDIGCEPADVSAARDVAWVLCADIRALVRSTDRGGTWSPPEALDSSTVAELSAVAAVDSDTAFVAGSGAGWVVENRVAKPAEGIGDVTYDFVTFPTDKVGYLIGSDGHLCRTEDGGLTWQRVELP